MSRFGSTSAQAAPLSYLAAVILLVVGSAIAGMAGFDIMFNAITGGLPWLRSGLFAVMTIAGLLCAGQVGLALLPKRGSSDIAMALGIGLAMACAVAVTDGILFRSIVPRAYIAFIEQNALGFRLIYFLTRAFNEEIFYRLILMSVIAGGLRLVRGCQRDALPDAIFWIAIAAAQIIAIALNLLPSLPPAAQTPTFALYAALRFIFPGILWGYLYWRHGFVTAEIAHVSTHIFLQPLLGHSFAHA